MQKSDKLQTVKGHSLPEHDYPVTEKKIYIK
jgi:hypothetical protein